MVNDAAAGTVTIRRSAGHRYRLESEILVPGALPDVFAFFSDAHNLERLTPPWLRFRVVTPSPIAMERGATIDYQLRVRGIPLRWTSEIDAWEPPHRFVDRQRRGPYALWVHEHGLEQVGGKTLVRDQVDFAARGGALAGWVVSHDLRRIFAYRHARLADIFAPR